MWPWVAIAGLGALHGLSPANGWMFAAARGVRARDDAQARWALLPIAVGHVASVAVVAWAVAKGLSLDPSSVQGVAGALLVGAASCRLLRGAREPSPIDARAGHAGIALWSFLMATAHGAGLMLVPFMLGLCAAPPGAPPAHAAGHAAVVGSL